MTEAKLTKKFCDQYRQARPMADVYKVNDRVARSRPDVQIMDAGQTWFIEFKRWDGTVSLGQQRELDRLTRSTRGRAYVAWFGEDQSVRFARPGAIDVACASIPAAVDQMIAWVLARALD